jgi:hypothetical protein
MARAGASLAALAMLIFSTRVALADPRPAVPSTVARLEVHAPPDCATKEALAARVQARAPRVRFGDDDGAWSIRAWFVSTGASRVVAEVVVAGPDGKTASRHLVAQTCNEAAEGVALIVAVTLDPSAMASESVASSSPPNATSPSASPTAGSHASATPPATSSSPTAPPARPALPSPEEQSEARATFAAEARHGSARWQIGADVAVQGFVGPGPWVMPGVAIYFAAAIDRQTVWSPAIYLGATHAWITGLQRPGGTAAFFLDAGSLDACPVRIHLLSLDARACVSGLGGDWASSGSATVMPHTRSRPFAVAGAAAILTLHLGSIFVIAARISGGATLVRDSYEFGDRAFYRAGPVTGSGSLGLGVRWP